MKRLLAGAVALCTVASVALSASAVSAQPYRHDRHEVRRDRHEIRQDRRELRHDRRVARRHRWRRGERLNRRYGAYANVDWRRHHLRRPYRGYHWVRQGDDYVLAALAGGLIASVVAANGR